MIQRSKRLSRYFLVCSSGFCLKTAKKLLKSGAFGVAGNEYVNYAKENRAEWAAKGESIVKDMLAKRETSATDLSAVDQDSEDQDSTVDSFSD